MADTVTNSSDAVLVLATLNDDLDGHFLGPVISYAAKTTRNQLTVVLFSRHFNESHLSERIPHTQLWDDVQKLLTIVYVQATSVAQEMGRVLMDVDVLLKGIDDELSEELGAGVDVCYRVEDGDFPVKLPSSLSSLRTVYLQAGERSVSHDKRHLRDSIPPLFPVVILGGTFDHLHAGHKILLSMGAWIASQKLIVGITDDALLGSKAFHEVLESMQVRTNRVRAFLVRFNSKLVHDIVPITDVYGPTGWDANIQALVVSKETLPGAASIASRRESLSLPPLETFVIDVISSTSAKLDHDDIELLKKTKMSSTFVREWIVQNQNHSG